MGFSEGLDIGCETEEEIKNTRGFGAWARQSWHLRWETLLGEQLCENVLEITFGYVKY